MPFWGRIGKEHRIYATELDFLRRAASECSTIVIGDFIEICLRRGIENIHADCAVKTAAEIFRATDCSLRFDAFDTEVVGNFQAVAIATRANKVR